MAPRMSNNKLATATTVAAAVVLVLLAMAQGAQSATTTIDNGMPATCTFVLFDDTYFISPTATNVGAQVSWTYETTWSQWFRVSIRNVEPNFTVKTKTLQIWDRRSLPDMQSFWKVNETAIYSRKRLEPGVWNYVGPWDLF